MELSSRAVCDLRRILTCRHPAAASAVAAELNRYAYTGHGAAGLRWLETIWPGNDEIKAELVTKLRQTHAKSAFAEDLASLAAGR